MAKRDLRPRGPKRFIKNPYAWECVKAMIAELDPRDTTALENHFKRQGDLPAPYVEFDNFIADIATGRKRIHHTLTVHSRQLLTSWRGTGYLLPLDEPTLTVLSFLPMQLGLKALIAKDALMKAGFYEREFYAMNQRRRVRMVHPPQLALGDDL